jgi:2,4-dienoyl-CoA reductase-like NADH-dependent reductase (Old Yellow Enzyme family)/pyruvate/2-oxoglutarate dehydrogenase complex dihydrolipoamide dehydrogenase (E3) component
MTSNRFPHLFSPLQVGPMRVPNRICETTNSIGASASGGFLDERFIEHHVAKARGGTGWIGSETWLLNSPLAAGAQEEFYPGAAAIRHALYQVPEFLATVSRFCQEVHAANAVAVFQLTHLNHAMAASSVPVTETYDYIPHELDEDMIEFILKTYVDAAVAARDAGADGIEIHCAHETVPQTFLSPATNLRTDRWGGGPRERIRFVVEALERIRRRVGDSLALGIRINGMESRQGGYDHMAMREMTYHLGETGLLDFVDIDVGHGSGVHAYVPPSFYGHAEYREVGKAARADLDAKIAVLFSGRINDPVLAEELLSQGYFDLVGMTRAGIADPEFANKARDGRLIEIRRCIGCNRCIGEAVHSFVPDALRAPICSVNPVVGNELRWQEAYRVAAKPKQVVVVGGGAAGLEAARVAAMRGHQVTLLEKGKRLGGQLGIAAKAPGRDSFEDQIYFQENEMARLGVTVRLAVDVDAAMIESLAPDAVVLATGSLPRAPAHAAGVDLPHVAQGWDVLRGKAQLGKRVAVISQEDYFETPNVAEFIAELGKEVEIFHKSAQLGAFIDRYSIGGVMSRLEEREVKIHPNVRLAAIDGEGFDLVSAFGGKTCRRTDFDSIVLVYGSVPNTALHDQLKASGRIKELYLIGSAWVPRRIAEATRHGANVGLII